MSDLKNSAEADTIKSLTNVITCLSAALLIYESPKTKPALASTSLIEKENDKVFAACIEEYRALRAEQLKRFEVADKNLNYLVIIIAAALGATISLLNTQREELVASIILLIPLLATPFIFVALSNELMIVRLGVYCHEVLRPLIISLAKNERLWDWERYHVRQSRGFLFQVSGFLRRLAFIIPSVAPLVIFALLKPPPFTSREIILLITDAALGLSTVVMLFYAVAAFAKAVTNVK
jgi:hypothetical protein